MTEKQFNEICSYLQAIVNCLQKTNFDFCKKGFEINTKESLTSQEHYTVQDLIKTFIREKPELLAMAKEVDDSDAPEFPLVDAHDDIIDIQEKLENAQERQIVGKSFIQVDSKEQLQQSSEKIEEDKKEGVVVSNLENTSHEN